MIRRLVLGGAGSRYTALLGAVYKLRYRLQKTKHFVGVSAGGVLSALLAMRCVAKELMIKEQELPFRFQFQWIFSGLWHSLVYSDGFVPIAKLREYLSELLEKLVPQSSTYTFKRLFEIYGTTLEIQVLDWHKAKKVVFSRQNSPEMLVLDALTASCSIPLVFSPFVYEGTIYCDSAIFSGAPWSSLFNKDNHGHLFMPVYDEQGEKIKDPLTVAIILKEFDPGLPEEQSEITWWQWINSFNPYSGGLAPSDQVRPTWTWTRVLTLSTHALKQQEHGLEKYKKFLIEIPIDTAIYGTMWNSLFTTRREKKLLFLEGRNQAGTWLTKSEV